jgi:hypothetical protein
VAEIPQDRLWIIPEDKLPVLVKVLAEMYCYGVSMEWIVEDGNDVHQWLPGDHLQPWGCNSSI